MNIHTKSQIVKKKLTELSKKNASLPVNYLRLTLALERAVARLEFHKKLSNCLIFKGGFVLLKTIESDRFTRDIDALAYGISKKSVPDLIKKALSVDLDDGFWFGDFKIDNLIDQGIYGGYRISCAFHIGTPEKNKIKKLSRIHIDIGFGDYVDIPAKPKKMKSVLDNEEPVSWKVYPVEYIFAEKLETLISRGEANSRAKDIYDMVKIFPRSNPTKLKTAIRNVFINRKTTLPKPLHDSLINFDTTILRNAWGSVEITTDDLDFETSWANLLEILKNIK